MPDVVNRRRESFDVYVGRPPGVMGYQHFGNPFGMSGKVTVPVATRDDAVAYFRTWLETGSWPGATDELVTTLSAQREWILGNMSSLRGKTLGCWCAPLPCHGTVLAELAHDEAFQLLNDRIWGAGNWVRCPVCPLDDNGRQTYHHKDFHLP